MRIKTRNLLLNVFLLLLAGAGFHPIPALGGDDTLTFTPKAESGERFRTKTAWRMDLALTLPDAAQEGELLVEFKGEEESETLIMREEGGRPLKVEKTFKKNLEVTDSPVLGGRNERKGFLQGRTFAVERVGEEVQVNQTDAPEGAVKDVPEKILGRLREEITLPQLGLFPTEPVSPGFRWKRSGAVLCELIEGISPGNFKEGTASFHLKNVTMEEGIRTAVIVVETLRVTLDGGFQGVNLELKMQGTLGFSLDKGRTVSLRLKGLTEVKKDARGMTGSGTIEITRESQPVNK
ncbi:MAG: hypothetical protein ACYTHN_07995 [Planctomycetota bacterium]|jgi:hypothetical protein